MPEINENQSMPGPRDTTTPALSRQETQPRPKSTQISQTDRKSGRSKRLVRYPDFSSVALLVQPMAAALLAWLILEEALGPMQTLGGGGVLLGIALTRRASLANEAARREAGD